MAAMMNVLSVCRAIAWQRASAKDVPWITAKYAPPARQFAIYARLAMDWKVVCATCAVKGAGPVMVTSLSVLPAS